MLRLIIKERAWSRLFAVATAATFFGGHKSSFVNAAAKNKKALKFCLAPVPFINHQSSEKISHRTMATSTGGKNDKELVGALQKAGITKLPKDVTDEEWAKILSPAQYAILRESNTERPYTGAYLDTTDNGVYHCAACGAMLFKSETKFESHCGWPAFYAGAKTNEPKASATDDGTNVARRSDESLGIVRTEIFCKKCGSHLGHVFDDGPQPTGERHCVNSASIEFVPSAVSKK